MSQTEDIKFLYDIVKDLAERKRKTQESLIVLDKKVEVIITKLETYEKAQEEIRMIKDKVHAIEIKNQTLSSCINTIQEKTMSQEEHKRSIVQGIIVGIVLIVIQSVATILSLLR